MEFAYFDYRLTPSPPLGLIPGNSDFTVTRSGGSYQNS